MIDVLILLAMQVATTPALPAEEEIVVIGKRMDSARYDIKVGLWSGAARCRITRSSGDAEIDAQVCEIARSCAKSQPRRSKAIATCITAKRREFLEAYARSGERG